MQLLLSKIVLVVDPSESLETYVNSAIWQVLVESNDCLLVVKVDNVFTYNVYLLTYLRNYTSECLFALASKKLCRKISSIISSNSACLIVKFYL